MRLDPVHDIQRTFRMVMDATARPGTVVDLKPEAARIDLEGGVNLGLLLLGLMLLDAEATFHCWPERDDETEELLSQLTYARAGRPEKADFLFVAGACTSVEDAFRRARLGTLIDPHLGATIVMEAAAVESGGPLVLTGPGIDGTARIRVARSPEWIGLRAELNREFPLGVDLFMVDAGCRLVSLPRTTRIEIDGET